ncbi:hypothetical protein F5144DRAFT_583853 [Chaetomium tenue]|uniref:Uncharacterized protein n=1 Tax=Chaetomium tenue TaxID=1854479 RepID=A0ACB7P4Q3_9PEZI|nr:hypothetical protein F5144DRAFT_583853 [Chaetomium globosum]
MHLPEVGKAFLILDFLFLAEKSDASHHFRPIDMRSLLPVRRTSDLCILHICPARQALTWCWVHIATSACSSVTEV